MVIPVAASENRFWGNKKRKRVVQLWSANFDLSVCVCLCRLLRASFCCKIQKKAIGCSIENRNPVILDWSWKEAIDPLVRLCVQSCSVNSQLCVNEDGWCGHLSKVKARSYLNPTIESSLQSTQIWDSQEQMRYWQKPLTQVTMRCKTQNWLKWKAEI